MGKREKKSLNNIRTHPLSRSVVFDTGGPSSEYEGVFFALICERSAKRDMLDHAKRDSRLTAYGGVVLQRLEGLNL